MNDSLGTAQTLSRDYDYESQLTDSSNNYNRSTISIPLTFGLKWKFSESVQGRVYTTYILSQSDFIDNYSIDGKNDNYLYTGFSLHVTLRKRDRSEEERYKNVDFAEVQKSDSDNDGVNDFNDECPGTPAGAKVNGKGCPLDDDKDGVPNHIDREPKSAKGVVVDEYGITVDDQYLARVKAARDSVSTVRSQAFANNPNANTLTQFDENLKQGQESGGGVTTSENKIPDKFKEADINNDGIIQSTEITATIDKFFEGTSSFTVAKIQDLIDFFFEQ